MNRRDRHWRHTLAKLLRLWLVMELGGRCAKCGKEWKLEVDHIDGREYEVEALDSLARVVRYIQEYWAGVRLQVLCQQCNGRDGRARQDDHEEIPF